MLTSKQRAFLKSKANTMDSIFQVGKGSVGDNMIVQIGQALKKRELIKINVLKNCDEDVRDVAEEIARLSEAEVVACIGKKVILYKENSEQKLYDLSKI